MKRKADKISGGDEADPVYFWKPDGPNGFLGQWYPSTFTEITESGEELKYENCEQ